MLRNYFVGCQGLIFFIDSTDADRLDGRGGSSDSAKYELCRILEDLREFSKTVPVLVFANKQDLPHALSVKEIIERLDLNSLPADRKWFIQGCSAVSCQGLYEGLDWLAEQVHEQSGVEFS